MAKIPQKSKPSSRAKPKPDDPVQSKRFIETAKELGENDDPKAFDKAIKKIAPPKKRAT